jgi:hypothetical protein
MCKGDGDEKCFTSSSDKHCDHSVTTVKLDEVGDYLVFPSRYYTVDIIGSLPTRPIIPHNYFARQQKVLRHGKM